MDLALTRPSDDTVTRRIAVFIRCPWDSALEGVNLFTGRPRAVTPIESLVAFLAGEDVEDVEPGREKPPVVPSKTRPAGMARPMPPVARRPRRRGLVRRFADRLGWTIDLYRQRLLRRLARGGAGSWRTAS